MITAKAIHSRAMRVQLVAGLGFLALVMGAIISTVLTVWFAHWPTLERIWVLNVFVGAVVSRLWVIAVLPTFCYGAARVFDLRPWPTALGAVLSGELFLVAINVASAGLGGLHRNLLDTTVRVISLSLGMVLSWHAVRSARATATRGLE